MYHALHPQLGWQLQRTRDEAASQPKPRQTSKELSVDRCRIDGNESDFVQNAPEFRCKVTNDYSQKIHIFSGLGEGATHLKELDAIFPSHWHSEKAVATRQSRPHRQLRSQVGDIRHFSTYTALGVTAYGILRLGLPSLRVRKCRS